MRTPEAGHYPEVDRKVIAVAKEFEAGARTGWHRHARGQLIFAVEGVMLASAETGAWIVPPGHALWMPPGIAHEVTTHGIVSMRTAYVRPGGPFSLPDTCRVLRVSPLLEAALVALTAEPREYDEAGRGGHLAALVLDEIMQAPATPFALPLPTDPRLARLARALIGAPGSGLDIDGWAQEAGVSRRTLTRRFRIETGLSFGAWRRRLRLMEATARHADGEPLGRVAAALGYGSVAAFRAMARKELGIKFD